MTVPQTIAWTLMVAVDDGLTPAQIDFLTNKARQSGVTSLIPYNGDDWIDNNATMTVPVGFIDAGYIEEVENITLCLWEATNDHTKLKAANTYEYTSYDDEDEDNNTTYRLFMMDIDDYLAEYGEETLGYPILGDSLVNGFGPISQERITLGAMRDINKRQISQVIPDLVDMIDIPINWDEKPADVKKTGLDNLLKSMGLVVDADESFTITLERKKTAEEDKRLQCEVRSTDGTLLFKYPHEWDESPPVQLEKEWTGTKGEHTPRRLFP